MSSLGYNRSMLKTNLEEQIKDFYGLVDVSCERLDTPTNDVEVVTAGSRKFALKIYNTGSRGPKEVAWEMALTHHLVEKGAPVVKPIEGRDGYIGEFEVDGQSRAAVLFEWVPGEKPKPERSTYVLLGRAAAQIHAAADSFRSPLFREPYDAHKLIDDQLERMKPLLAEAGQWETMVAMGARLREAIAGAGLDWGVCHMDLTLDNVHRDGDRLTVFDFDSAGECWRALEPHGVLRFSEEYFQNWLEGYREVREFDKENERAVAAFAVIGDLRVVAWKLGVAASSRGKPLLTVADVPDVVDGWLELEGRA